MNKEGYIRILEAIIALVIVLAYVISILPKAPQSTGETPLELATIQKTVLDQMQNNEKFRTCIVYGRIIYKDEATGKTIDKDDVSCVNDAIVSSLPPFSPWQYAFSLCSLGITPSCEYLPNKDAQNNPITDDAAFASKALPANIAVYSKSMFLSVPDVATSFYTEGQTPSNKPIPNKILRVYMWSTI